MNKNTLSLRNNLMSMVGSFWSKMLEKKEAFPQAVNFTRLLFESNFANALDDIVKVLGGNLNSIRYNEVIKIDYSSIIRIGPTIMAPTQETDSVNYSFELLPDNYVTDTNYSSVLLDDQNRVITTDCGSLLLFKVNDYRKSDVIISSFDLLTEKYALPIPKDVFPISLYANNRILICGVDYQCFEGVLLFKEYPSWLQNGLLHMKASYVQDFNIFRRQLNAGNIITDGRHIMSHVRGSQAPHYLELACAEYAGLYIMPSDSILLTLKITGVYARTYFFDFGSVDINYPHTELVIGNLYTKDTILGNVFSLSYKTNYNDLRWYESCLPDCIDLSNYAGIANFKVYNKAYKFVSNGSHSGHWHCKTTLNIPNESSFWTAVNNYEVNNSVYMSDIVGITGDNQTVYYNLMELLFLTVLQERTIIANLSAALPDYIANKLVSYLNREKPLDVIYFTRTI